MRLLCKVYKMFILLNKFVSRLFFSFGRYFLEYFFFLFLILFLGHFFIFAYFFHQIFQIFIQWIRTQVVLSISISVRKTSKLRRNLDFRPLLKLIPEKPKIITGNPHISDVRQKLKLLIVPKREEKTYNVCSHFLDSFWFLSMQFSFSPRTPQ